MEKSITINPSVAFGLNIDSIGETELVSLIFTADENWLGTYSFDIWNSDKKNNKLNIEGTSLTTENLLMTLVIEPQVNKIPTGVHYYEISHVESKRVLFKGNLNIIK